MTAIAGDPVQTTDQSVGRSIAFDLAASLIVALLYFLGAEAAFMIGTLSDKVFAPLWPPNSILVGVLAFVPPHRWWLVLAAAFPAHLCAEWSIGMRMPELLVAYATNCALAAMSAGFIQAFIGKAMSFATLRNAVAYVGAIAVAIPAFVALGGAFVQVLTSGVQTYWLFWLHWFAANALGAVTLSPLALCALGTLSSRRAVWRNARIVEYGIVVLLLVVTTLFALRFGREHVPQAYVLALFCLPVPAILWSAARFGAPGASGAASVVVALLLWHILKGHEPFGHSDAEGNVFAIQVLALGIAVPAILLGATIAQTRDAERASREREERMAFAAASSQSGLWIYSYEQRQFWATDHSRTMFDLAPFEPLGLRSLLAHVWPADGLSARNAMWKAINERAPADFDFRISSGGDVRWIAVRARPHRDAEGNVTSMTGTFADVTARKKAEEQANARQQEIAHLMRVSMLGELSGGIAHELTQPLTAILSNAQAGRLIIEGPSPDLNELGGILDDIAAEDGRAGQIIHRLRVLLKKGDIRYEAVELKDLIRSTLSLLHSELISRKVTVEANLDQELQPVRGDPIQLQQVMLNLFLNSIDAMEELSPSRRIIVVHACMTDDDMAEISIADRGTGLPPQGEQLVFQPFFTTKRRGLGLGLSICTTIVKSHGGGLTLENNDGEGASATIRLPVHSM